MGRVKAIVVRPVSIDFTKVRYVLVITSSTVSVPTVIHRVTRGARDYLAIGGMDVRGQPSRPACRNRSSPLKMAGGIAAGYSSLGSRKCIVRTRWLVGWLVRQACPPVGKPPWNRPIGGCTAGTASSVTVGCSIKDSGMRRTALARARVAGLLVVFEKTHRSVGAHLCAHTHAIAPLIYSLFAVVEPAGRWSTGSRSLRLQFTAVTASTTFTQSCRMYGVHASLLPRVTKQVCGYLLLTVSSLLSSSFTDRLPFSASVRFTGGKEKNHSAKDWPAHPHRHNPWAPLTSIPHYSTVLYL